MHGVDLTTDKESRNPDPVLCEMRDDGG